MFLNSQLLRMSEETDSETGRRRKVLVYQDIDRLINGSFDDNVLDPGLIHVHGPAVLEDSAGSMEVLGTVDLVGAVEEEVSCLVGHS